MNETLDEIVTKQAEELIQKQSATVVFDPNKSPTEQAKDIVDVLSTQRAVEDQTLVGEITDAKKKELLSHANASLKKGEAENKNADIQLQEANYGVYSGVANYAGIKKPLPQNMQKVLFIILSIFQTILLIGWGLPISVVNIVADGIDSIVKKLGSITKSAMWIVLLSIGVLSVFGVVLLVRFLVIKLS